MTDPDRELWSLTMTDPDRELWSLTRSTTEAARFRRAGFELWRAADCWFAPAWLRCVVDQREATDQELGDRAKWLRWLKRHEAAFDSVWRLGTCTTMALSEQAQRRRKVLKFHDAMRGGELWAVFQAEEAQEDYDEGVDESTTGRT